MTVRLITANRRHIEALTRLHAALYTEIQRPVDAIVISKNTSTMIDDPRAQSWILFSNNTAVALASISLTFGVQEGWSATLTALYVTPDFRSQGCSRLLLNAAVSWAREQGATAVRTVRETGEQSKECASAFLSHLGFCKIPSETLVLPLD